MSDNVSKQDDSLKFYIDSANADDIKRVYDRIYKLDPTNTRYTFGGVTTNPSSLSKIQSVTTYTDMKNHLVQLGKYLGEIGAPELHTQIPNSRMPIEHVCRFVEDIGEVVYRYPRIQIKVPPRRDILELDPQKYRGIFNVTGLASIFVCDQVLKFESVRYASLIPGRMNAAMLDYIPHLGYKRNMLMFHKKTIAGSMRTADDVLLATEFGFCPTVGIKVFDLMSDDDIKKMMDNLRYPEGKMEILRQYDREWLWINVPEHDSRYEQVSADFFDQMDELGSKIHSSFTNQFFSLVRPIYQDDRLVP